MPALISRKNLIINGNFKVWQRAVSQTSNGYGSDDRWQNGNSISTKTHTRKNFVVGQAEVPDNPRYYSQTVVVSGGTASSYADKVQKIEGVRTLAGKTGTLTFWAKADAPKEMSISFRQFFGTGGTPSTAIDGIGATKLSLSTAWQKFTVTVDFPSISGKVMGTALDDSLQLYMWFDAGSTFDARTDSLGNQSGTFDIAQVQLEEGATATPFDDRTFGAELQLCQRYYTKSYAPRTSVGGVTTSGAVYCIRGSASAATRLMVYGSEFKVSMRVIPVLAVWSPAGVSNQIAQYNNSGITYNVSGWTSGSKDRLPGFVTMTASVTQDDEAFQFHYEADAEL